MSKNKIDIGEHLVRLEIMLAQVQEDVREIKDLEKRIVELEKSQQFLKGFSMFATAVFSTVIGVFINYFSKKL